MFDIVKMKFGSHLYGTSTPNSDKDFKGVFMPSVEQICLGEFKESITSNTKEFAHQKNTPDDVDMQMYSLQYFIKLATKSDTGAIDMLHAPDDAILIKHSWWDEIVRHRHMFYSKDLTTFVEYTKKQTGKYAIKGSRLNTVLELMKILEQYPPQTRMREIWDRLPINDYSFIVFNEATGDDEYSVVDKKIQKTARVHYFLDMLNNFWKKYGHRAVLAAANKGVDWKAVSHAVRAAIQTKQLFTDGTITYPLKDAPYLIDIKLGKLDYNTVASHLEDLVSEVLELRDKSNLPEKVNVEYWRWWVVDKVSERISV